MSYSDGRFTSRSMERLGYITGTATASGTNALVGGADIKTDGVPPAFVRRSAITSVSVVNNIATPVNWTALKVIVKNGTSTVASGTVTAGTAGQTTALTVTAANGTFAAAAAPTFVIDGTSTASGQSIGTLVVWAEVQELFS